MPRLLVSVGVVASALTASSLAAVSIIATWSGDAGVAAPEPGPSQSDYCYVAELQARRAQELVLVEGAGGFDDVSARAQADMQRLANWSSAWTDWASQASPTATTGHAHDDVASAPSGGPRVFGCLAGVDAAWEDAAHALRTADDPDATRRRLLAAHEGAIAASSAVVLTGTSDAVVRTVAEDALSPAPTAAPG